MGEKFQKTKVFIKMKTTRTMNERQKNQKNYN